MIDQLFYEREKLTLEKLVKTFNVCMFSVIGGTLPCNGDLSLIKGEEVGK